MKCKLIIHSNHLFNIMMFDTLVQCSSVCWSHETTDVLMNQIKNNQKNIIYEPHFIVSMNYANTIFYHTKVWIQKEKKTSIYLTLQTKCQNYST